MQMDQHDTQCTTALLCRETSVDTLETNSLCCAAVGIIDPLSATAEALIPHEKLRGAALADATLNAQERPLAQPVVGYKPPTTQSKALDALRSHIEASESQAQAAIVEENANA